ncbi:alpha-E domain-containing protein [Nisaea acidiphila]|uniref:Alpha-E domain-containing protein n=1 Tax=Nisaea acidiphila TaxID=1862145 RepID=A0A9J7AZZ2_9PROT|nr:alpha-E domain-containing protein [Nisaea acidiphila]UUX51013.1 alpha-E domain-containing protein [Nisaea acidiphila]
MLGKSAGGLYWMFRYLERSENLARLLEAGFRIALTRSSAATSEWQSVVATAGVTAGFEAKHDEYTGANVVDFLLRDRDNSSSVRAVTDQARTNARMVRTALTREVWEATNECWMVLNQILQRPIRERDLPEILSVIKQQSTLVRGTMFGTMLRNDIYNFSRLGTFIERADNTARILDVKYYVLLPSLSHVGSSLDNVQWETILRSVSANRSYRWLNGEDINPSSIADFLILDRSMPRSLAHCVQEILVNLNQLAVAYDERKPCHECAEKIFEKLDKRSIDSILASGLHEFLKNFIQGMSELSSQIEQDYRFYS